MVPYPPAAPSLVQAAGGGLSVIWTSPAVDGTHGLATAFNLQYSPSGANNWTVITGVTTPYRLSNIAAGAAFDIQLQSVNAAGTSAWSTTSTASTAAAPPNAPAAPSLAQGAGTDLLVTWVAPPVDSTHSAATGYNLRSCLSGTGNWATVSGVTSPYDLPGLTGGVPMDIQIQGINAAGISPWSATSTLTTAMVGPYAPNAPTLTSVEPPGDGTNSSLTATWAAPAVDNTHGAATGYNLRYSPSGAGTWTTVSNVTSPFTITGLSGASAIDVEVQATNAAASPSAWSAVVTGTTWGATVAQGGWVAAATQTHGANVAPSGGAQMFATAAPTAVTGAAFAWSTSNTVVPTANLIAAAADGQTNGWGQYFTAPATAGTYYLWLLAQGAGNATIGALVTSAITVS